MREQIEAALNEGKTVIVAEHRLDFISDLVTRALLIDNGRIARSMTSKELLELDSVELEELGLRNPNHKRIESISAKCKADEGEEGGGRGLVVQGLTVERKGKDVFKPASFNVPPGTVLGIVGANGAGKTTMLRALAGLERHVRGTVTLDCKTLKRKDRRRRFAYVMQDVNHQLFSDSVYAECELSVPLETSEEESAKQMCIRDRILSSPVLSSPAHPESPSGYDIAFDDVRFRYDGADRDALSGVSFTVPQGATVALVGPSGGGKTTAASLVPRFWDVGSGAVRIGGVDVRDMDAHRLMEDVAFVFQDLSLIHI